MAKKNLHWAQETAERIIKIKGDKEIYTLAAGITPSGMVHIGNFRELITVDLVKRALEARGKKTRFIFSWDDYDVFRKVPKNIPEEKQKTYDNFLGKPITSIPDPFTSEDSYAAFFEKKMEKTIPEVNVNPEFLYQSKKYLAGEYREKIKLVLKNNDKIKKIINQYRKTPLAEDWYPITIYCPECNYNQIKILNYDGENLIHYTCLRCQKDFQLDLRKDSNLKLLWRVDWPMRWAHEKVDFEPGGKDHSSDGGSYTTAKIISKEIFDYEPPVYLQYDFVLTKGKGSKLSSSEGEVITLDDLLEIYQPEVIRWIFSANRNNLDFAIAFDLDVVKTYDAYDRMERQFYEQEEISPQKKEKNKFTYTLAQTNNDFFKEKFQQFPFRHLANISQINEFSFEKIKKFLERKEPIDKSNLKNLQKRINCIKNWINQYAPENFKFILNSEKATAIPLENNYKSAISELKATISKETYKNNDKELANYLYDLIEKHGLEAKIFFEKIYLLLINKNQGPKLGNFLNIIEKEKILKLL